MPFFKKKPPIASNELPTIPNYEALFKAEIQKDACDVALALRHAKHGIKIYHTNAKGQTLLHIAVIQNKNSFIPELIQLGLALTSTDQTTHQKTPLDYYFEKHGEVESLKILVNNDQNALQNDQTAPQKHQNALQKYQNALQDIDNFINDKKMSFTK